MVIFTPDSGTPRVPGAAHIDEASAWQEFTRIVFPLLAPTTFFVLVVSVISSFQVFSQVYVMTGGGPLNRTLVLVYYLYNQAFGSFRISARRPSRCPLRDPLRLTWVHVLQPRIHYDN